MAKFDVFKTVLASKLEHFENDIHFYQNVSYTITLNAVTPDPETQ